MHIGRFILSRLCRALSFCSWVYMLCGVNVLRPLVSLVRGFCSHLIPSHRFCTHTFVSLLLSLTSLACRTPVFGPGHRGFSLPKPPPPHTFLPGCMPAVSSQRFSEEGVLIPSPSRQLKKLNFVGLLAKNRSAFVRNFSKRPSMYQYIKSSCFSQSVGGTPQELLWFTTYFIIRTPYYFFIFVSVLCRAIGGDTRLPFHPFPTPTAVHVACAPTCRRRG